MRTIFAAVLFAALSYQTASAQDRLMTGYPELPRDAKRLAERSQSCEHFAGEINGNSGELDRRANRAIKKLKCDRLEKDAKVIKHKYRNNPKVLRLVNESLEWLAA